MGRGDGRPIGPAMKHEEWVNGALFSRDESRILSWSDDRTLRLWDAATGRPDRAGDEASRDGLWRADSAGTKAASCRGRKTKRCGCGTRRRARRSGRR